MLNTTLKPSKTPCSYFAIFDGFSGTRTCNYLRDNLHKLLFSHAELTSNPAKAIQDAFFQAEKALFELLSSEQDSSGSCALVALIIHKYVYIANLGSSRCIESSLKGFEQVVVTTSHVPIEADERKRVVEAGCEVVDVNGTLRVRPGNLTVTRCFGCYKGKEVCAALIAVPEIRSTRVNKDMDFLLVMSDGVYIPVPKPEALKLVWSALEHTPGSLDFRASSAITSLLSTALSRSSDNLSAILIGFSRLHLSREARE
jgi:serine/threonine protein phosphatase PrpC